MLGKRVPCEILSNSSAHVRAPFKINLPQWKLRNRGQQGGRDWQHIS